MPHASSYFFLLVLLLSLVLQAALWRVDTFTDESLWVKRVMQLRKDVATNHFHPTSPVYSGHPGMAAVTLAAAVSGFGVELRTGLDISVAVLISLAAAASITICRSLRPQSIWWLAAGSFLLLHPLYLDATPTNAVAASWAVLIFLLTWRLLEQAPFGTAGLLIALGAAVGVGLITRTVTTALVSAPLLVLLGVRLGFKQFSLILMAALTASVAFDPLLWYTPLEHIRFILFRSSLNITSAVDSTTLSASDFFSIAPFSVLSLILAGALGLARKRLTLPLPSILFAALVAMTIVYVLVFLNVRAQSLRHFFPLILLWEVLLPLWIIHLGAAIRPLPAWKGKTIPLTAVIALVLAGSQVFLLLYAIHVSSRFSLPH